MYSQGLLMFPAGAAETARSTGDQSHPMTRSRVELCNCKKKRTETSPHDLPLLQFFSGESGGFS